ncbi:diacylglycerol/lipid kinase family protein [Bacillus thermotolerans]|uniref:diacylglycerol/lipid kinase family protein n=2 Tax=Bacillus thermotolerans TaxID=1221996 RepID=UPI00057DC103|nr:diacylglycerol kinase family protein [Bacillus thermotolerans]KKB38249.1 Transcription regulator [Bacillus thermotolerans]
MKKSMIIANPSSGKEEAEKYIELVKAQLTHNGYDSNVRYTEREGDATAFAADACIHGYDAIISIGGDGTLNETINGMGGKEHRPALGVVPLGTVNDFAHGLRIPLKPEEAIAVIGQGKLRKVDTGRVNDRYFINIIGLGKIAETTAEVSAEQKTVLGSLAYFLEGAKTLVNQEPFDITVQSSGQQWTGPAVLFLAVLTSSAAGFEQAAPGARADDGLLHCFVIQDTSLPQLARIGVNLLRGDFTKDKDVIYFRTQEAVISSSKPLAVNIDGDAGGQTPLNLKVLKQHIDVFVP